MTTAPPIPVETPAFVIDEAVLEERAERLARVSARAGCVPLYALKPFGFVRAMELLAPHLAGFSASSVFEARLARRVLGSSGQVHMTTPGFRPDEIDSVADLCDHVAFNSLGQWERLGPIVGRRARLGLRVNPQLPFIEDDRYNPCRKHSKLGVPLEALEALLGERPQRLAGLSGLHFHTNCDCDDFRPLLATVRHMVQRLGLLLGRLQWVNLGGGYLYGTETDTEPLREAVALLRETRDLEVFVEPGAALARPSACIVASVVDLFASDGATVAVLDTTVNHMPELFEYQESPEVEGATLSGPHRYTLAGCSCLAGDLFGEYAFAAPLALGSQVVFPNMGAYTMVKWSWFNGINIPTVYARTAGGRYVLLRRCEYEEFETRCGG